MKYRSYLAVGMAVIGGLIGWSLEQALPTQNWDEAKAREIALTISNGWKFSAGQFQSGAATNLQHRVYAVLPFDVPGTPRQLVLIASAPPGETCHACTPKTGGVMFALKAGTWQVAHIEPDIHNLGSFGKPPDAHLSRLGPAKPAVEFHVDSMAQGYQTSSVSFVAEVGEQLREVLSFVTSESNEGGAPPDETYRWQATLEVSKSIHQGFADVVVKSNGTKPLDDGQTVRPYSATTTYRFNGEAYTKVE